MIKTAEKFWKERREYPPVICNYQRRYLDLGMVLNNVGAANSILDLGCGEGQNLLMLRELTDIKNYYAYDLSRIFIDNLVARWGNHIGLEVEVKNFTTTKLPETDLCICMGVMLYVDDNALRIMLSNIKSKVFICRVPCSFEGRVEIDKFSEEFNSNYAAIYRTISEYISILSEFFNIKSIERCYPDELESVYGSKQFLFVGDIKNENE